MKNSGKRISGEMLTKVLIVLGLLMSLGAWAFSSPVGASPDDDFHLTSIWCAGNGSSGICEPAEKSSSRLVSDALTQSSCYASDANVSGACQTELGLFDNPGSSVTTRGSFEGNYPPVYYATMHLFAGQDIEFSAILMRFANIVLFAAFLFATLLLAPRVLSRTAIGIWALTTVPLGLFILGSNNPSSWAITGIGFGWIALYAFLTAQGRIQIPLGILYLLSVVVAAGARGDAAVYVILSAVLVVFLSFAKDKNYLLKLILPAAMILVGFFFYITSQQSGIATTGLPFGDSDRPAEARTPISVLFYNIVQLPFLLSGAFGTWNLGWLDTVMPAIVWVISLSLFSGVMFVALGKVSPRRAAALLGIALVIVALPLYVLQAALAHVGEQVQPRYVLPLIMVFAGVALLSLGEGKVSFSLIQLWLIFAGLAIAQSVALYMNTRRYVWGLDSSAGWNLNTSVQWWWPAGPSPMLNWAIGSVGFTLFLFAAGLFFKLTDSKIQESQFLSK